MNVQLSYVKQPCICIKMNWTLSSAQKCGLFSVLTENLLTVRNGLINKKVSLKKNYTDMMLKLKIEKGHQHGIVSSNTADLDLDLDAIAGI